MGLKFNPLTAQFDLTGSGGGQSYIDGEVATYNDLPLSSTTAPLNTAWLVRGSSGVWPFTKPGGVYVRTATGGTSRDADYTYAGIFPDVFSDAQFTLYDDADTSKNLKFQLSGLATGTTSTLTVPASGTIARTSDIPSTFAASAITSGVLDNARINFAAPSSIGSTTASTGAFTTLSASTSLTLGTSGILSGGTNTIEQRNTTSAQTFRIYNTVSGAADANYERGFMRWSSNVFQIGTEKAGTGSARGLELSVDGNRRFYIGTDGEVGIGSVAGLLSTHGIVVSTSGQQTSISHGGGRILVSGSAVTLDNGGSPILRVASSRVMFGGTTSSFPALKQSSTTLQVRLADDSAFAPLECAGLTLNGNLTASTRNIVTDTTTGTRIGTGTTQLLGFWNAAPSAQPAAVADATDAASTQARLNDLLSRLRTIGIIAT